MLLSSSIDEIVVSDKEVAAKVCQNDNSLLGGPVERSQHTDIASVDVALWIYLDRRRKGRRPGNRVTRSTMFLKAWHWVLAASVLCVDMLKSRFGDQ